MTFIHLFSVSLWRVLYVLAKVSNDEWSELKAQCLAKNRRVMPMCVHTQFFLTGRPQQPMLSTHLTDTCTSHAGTHILLYSREWNMQHLRNTPTCVETTVWPLCSQEA